MPKMSGDILHEAITHINPAAKVLLVSGYSLQKRIAALRAQGLKGFVPKPFNLQVLAEEVRRALDE